MEKESIGEGNGNPLQCSCLENPRDRGAWWAAVYGVAQNGTQLKRLSSSRSNGKFTNSWPGFVHLFVSFPELLFVLVILHNMNLINTSILLAKIFLVWMRNGRRCLVGCSPWGRTRLGATSLYFFTFMHWRRKWQPPPVFLPGETQGRGSLAGCRLWGRTRLKRLSSSSSSMLFYKGNSNFLIFMSIKQILGCKTELCLES